MKNPANTRVLMLLENIPFNKDPRVRHEAQALSQAGYQVTVICPSAQGQKSNKVFEGIKIYHYPFPYQGKGLLSYVFEYSWSLMATFLISLKLLIHPGFDIIHTANPPDIYIFIGIFYKLFGKKFIFDHHDLAPELFQERFVGKKMAFLYRCLLWLERVSCQMADLVITTNQSYKLIEMDRDRIPEEKIFIVRNGPDLSELNHPVEESIPGSNRESTLIYLGTIGVQDGVDHLINALKFLNCDLGRADFRCIIVGDGENLDSIKSLSIGLNLSKYIEFTGWVDYKDVFGYLKSADICMAPEPSNKYNDRSTMIKIMEYMLSGKPIVAFELPEHRFSAGEAAIYADPNDPEDFARKIEYLMDHPEIRLEMGNKGIERVKNELAWQHQAERLIAAYQTI